MHPVDTRVRAPRDANHDHEADACLTAWLDGCGTRDIVEREQGVLP